MRYIKLDLNEEEYKKLRKDKKKYTILDNKLDVEREITWREYFLIKAGIMKEAKNGN